MKRTSLCLLLVAGLFQPMIVKADLFDLLFHRSNEAKILKVPISRVLGPNWRERYHARVDTMIAIKIYEGLSVEDKKPVRDEVKKQLRVKFDEGTRLSPQILILKALCDNNQEFEKCVQDVVNNCMNSSGDLINDLERKVTIEVILEIDGGAKIRTLTDSFFDEMESNISGQELGAYLYQKARQQEMRTFFEEAILHKTKKYILLP